MTGFEAEAVLELDELLDPARLASAWQVAHERAPAAQPEQAMPPAADVEEAAGGGAAAGAAFDGDEVTAVDAAAAAPGAPAADAPLPVAVAHRRLLDELERTLAASPRFAAKGRRVLAGPLAQLAALLAPAASAAGSPAAAGPAVIDAEAVEAGLDTLEDVLQALLSAAGWPASGED